MPARAGSGEGMAKIVASVSHRLIAAIALAIIGPPVHASDGASLSGLSLPRIDGSRQRAELVPKARIGIIVVFEDQCGYCLTMLRTVQRIGDAHGWSAVAVGVGPSPSALMDWAKRAGVRMPIAHADTRFLARIGGVKVTPLTVLVDHSGDIRQRFVGSVDSTVLEAAANSEVP